MSWQAVHDTPSVVPIDVVCGLMISFELGVEDLADTRFALSPLGETVLSLRILRDPGISALHLPWYRSVLPRLGALDRELLRALVADRLTLPDFLTPRPTVFEPSFADELAVVRRTPPSTVTRDLLAAHSPNPSRTPCSPRSRPPCATGSARSWRPTGSSRSGPSGRRFAWSPRPT